METDKEWVIAELVTQRIEDIKNDHWLALEAYQAGYAAALERAAQLNPAQISRELYAKHKDTIRPEPTPDEAIVFTMCKIEALKEKAAGATTELINGKEQNGD